MSDAPKEAKNPAPRTYRARIERGVMQIIREFPDGFHSVEVVFASKDDALRLAREITELCQVAE